MNNKFIRIYEDIAERIRNGEIEAGTLLQSELELSERYQTSRETIRKALKMLYEEGYIQKIQGKGSIVLDIRKIDFPVSGLVSFKELAQKMGHRAQTVVKLFREQAVDQTLSQKTGFAQQQQVWQINRVRKVDGEQVILDKDYISQRLIPGLDEDICQDSIYEYIEQELGLSISYAKKKFWWRNRRLRTGSCWIWKVFIMLLLSEARSILRTPASSSIPSHDIGRTSLYL